MNINALSDFIMLKNVLLRLFQVETAGTAPVFHLLNEVSVIYFALHSKESSSKQSGISFQMFKSYYMFLLFQFHATPVHFYEFPFNMLHIERGLLFLYFKTGKWPSRNL